MPTLLQIFSTSQYLSDVLVGDTEGLDLLRLTEGEPVTRQALVDELASEIAALEHEDGCPAASDDSNGARLYASRTATFPRAKLTNRHRPRYPFWPTPFWSRPCGRPGGSSSGSAASPHGP